MSCSAKPTISKPITTCKTVTGSFPCEDRYLRQDGEQSCVVVQGQKIIQRYFPLVLNFSGSCLMISSGGLPPLHVGCPNPLALVPFCMSRIILSFWPGATPYGT